jgi:hypothetical protein
MMCILGPLLTWHCSFGANSLNVRHSGSHRRCDLSTTGLLGAAFFEFHRCDIHLRNKARLFQALEAGAHQRTATAQDTILQNVFAYTIITSHACRR